MLQRRQWNAIETTHCVLCPLKPREDRIHLLFDCNFSAGIWNYLQIQWQGNTGNDLQQVLHVARRSFGHPFFMEVLILACWNIWIIRIAKIFNSERPTLARWKACFVHDIQSCQNRDSESDRNLDDNITNCRIISIRIVKS
jgi:hypothetical protein